jgi:DDE family transposase
MPSAAIGCGSLTTRQSRSGGIADEDYSTCTVPWMRSGSAQRFEPFWEREQVATGRRRRRATRLSSSQLMTILILIQQSGYRAFKGFYTRYVTHYVQTQLRAEFPALVSYSRFVALIPRVLLPLAVSRHMRFGACSGISFVDSTSLSVCKNARIAQHRVFRVDARQGKTSVGWFYRFKLHCVVHDCGEALAVCLTPSHVADRRPVPRLVRRLFGKLLGDRDSIAQALAERLFTTQGLALITNVRKNMHERQRAYTDTVLLRKRAIIGSVNDQLKNVCQFEHSRHRSLQLPGAPAGRIGCLLPPAQEAVAPLGAWPRSLGGRVGLIHNSRHVRSL